MGEKPPKTPKLAKPGQRQRLGQQRLDEMLVARSLAASIDLARALVMAGKVIVDDQRVDKPGAVVTQWQVIRLKGEDTRFVSRAGKKLEQALIDLQLTEALKGAVVLDVGASTGGFTHCCLEHGAKQVIAVDVGTAQLAWQLRQDPRVVSVERTDIRDFVPEAYPLVDWVVADVSFNSLARLAPAIRGAAPGAGVYFLLLIKPQFELPRQDIPDGGVVTDEGLRQKAVQAVREAFAAVGLGHGVAIDARVSGKSGNIEIFYFVQSGSSA